jgi:hypothetical protein
MLRVLGQQDTADVLNQQNLPIPVVTGAPETLNKSSLINYLDKCWRRAWEAKIPITDKLMASLRQYNCEYDPVKLSQIRQLKGSEVFVPLTVTKCNAAIAQISDIVFQPAVKPWDIDPTPVPNLPLEIDDDIKKMVYAEIAETLGMIVSMTGTPPDAILERITPDITKRINKERIRRAKVACEELSQKMEDQLQEGGWYKALKDCLFDLVVYKTAIVKNCVLRTARVMERIPSPMGGFTTEITDKVVVQFDRVSPFNFYPGPNSKNVQTMPYCFEKLTLSTYQLETLIGVEGFDEEAIRNVLKMAKFGGLKDWTTFDLQARAAMTGEFSFDTVDEVDVLEFRGWAQGSTLQEHGVEIEDPDRFYHASIWYVKNEVLKAVTNPDPTGGYPYSTASYITKPDSIWGDSLAEVIEPLQQMCNAIARSIVNNAGIASGPLVEYNEDRLPLGFDQTLYPWKTFMSTDTMMSGNPAVKFYQPSIVVDQLVKVFDYFSKLADEYTIPAYAHGDLNVGGGGNTASGLSMLMSSANRIIKHVIKNLDLLIMDSIRQLYNYNIIFEGADTYLGDINVVARGSASMLQKEQQTARRNEFLQATNNPADLQIMGQNGRRELLFEVARSIDLENPDKILPEIDAIEELKRQVEESMMQQMQAMAPELESSAKGGVPPTKGKTLDVAGNPASGQDARLIKQDQAINNPRKRKINFQRDNTGRLIGAEAIEEE